MRTQGVTITGVIERMLDHAANGRWREVFLADTAALLATLADHPAASTLTTTITLRLTARSRGRDPIFSSF